MNERRVQLEESLNQCIEELIGLKTLNVTDVERLNLMIKLTWMMMDVLHEIRGLEQVPRFPQ